MRLYWTRERAACKRWMKNESRSALPSVFHSRGLGLGECACVYFLMQIIAQNKHNVLLRAVDALNLSD